MSGAKASRPELAKALARIQRGDVLVVARLDRLARSLSHRLSVIAELDAKGAHLKTLADPIDTRTPQGRFALQVPGAVAEFERALIGTSDQTGLSRLDAASRFEFLPGFAARVIGVRRDPALARLPLCVER